MKRFLRACVLGVASTLILSFFASLIGCRNEETTESKKKKTDKVTEKIEETEDPEETPVPATSETTESPDTATSSDPAPSSSDPADPAVELPDEVATRLSADPIEDFVPGSDYGEIFPFTGNTLVEGTNYGTVGLFDAQGRIVCDPVYHGVFRYDENGFIVYRYQEDSTYSTAKCGFLSRDGSAYTGLIYDDYFCEGDQFYFVNIDQRDITIIPFDLSGAKAGDPIQLKTLLEQDKSFDHFSTVIDERYILYVDDYGFPTVIADGTTGKEVHYPDCDGLFYGTRAGHVYILSTEIDGSASDGSAGPIFAVYTISGEKLFDRTTFTAYQYNGGDQVLFKQDNDWVVTDLEGNRIHTLVEDPEHPIRSFYQTGDYYIATYDDKIECYSKDFEHVYGVDTDSPSDYYTVDADYTVPEDAGAALSPILYTMDDSVITFLDPVTGKTGTALSMNMSGEPKHIPGRILISYMDYDLFAWAILDDSDFHLISEGSGQPETIYDRAQEKYYLLLRDSYYSGKASLIDASSGAVVMQDILNPEEIRIGMDIYDGEVLYSTILNPYDDDVADQHPFTALTEMDDQGGTIRFLYYAENGYAG